MTKPADPLEEQTLESRLAFRGVFLEVYADRVRSPDGHEGVREYMRHPGAVMVIPLLGDGQVVLERQYRYPVRRSFVELPAGKIDAGEALLDCARRELREETGYEAPEWTSLGRYAVDGNRGCGVGHLYLARRARRIAEPVADDLEEQELLTLGRDEVEAALLAGGFGVLSWAAAVALALVALDRR